MDKKINYNISRVKWEIQSAIMANLEKAGITVHCAPFEGDSQLVY